MRHRPGNSQGHGVPQLAGRSLFPPLPPNHAAWGTRPTGAALVVPSPPRQVGLEGAQLTAHLHFQQRPRRAAVGGCCPARLRPHTAACERMRRESPSLPRQERRVLLWPRGLCGQARPRCPLTGPSAPGSCARQGRLGGEMGGRGTVWALARNCPAGSPRDRSSRVSAEPRPGDSAQVCGRGHLQETRSGPGRCGLPPTQALGAGHSGPGGSGLPPAGGLRAGPGHCPSQWGLHTDGRCHPEAGKAGPGRQVSSCRLIRT